MMGSCYSGAPINYTSAHYQQKKRSFKTKDLSRKKIPDSKQKTKEEEDFDQRRRTVVKKRRSDENESVRKEGRTEKQTTLRPGATKPCFMDLLLLGPRSRPHSRVHTCPLNLWPRGRNIKEQITEKYSDSFSQPHSHLLKT